jgi:hypothetical protein
MKCKFCKECFHDQANLEFHHVELHKYIIRRKGGDDDDNIIGEITKNNCGELMFCPSVRGINIDEMEAIAHCVEDHLLEFGTA